MLNINILFLLNWGNLIAHNWENSASRGSFEWSFADSDSDAKNADLGEDKIEAGSAFCGGKNLDLVQKSNDYYNSVS